MSLAPTPDVATLLRLKAEREGRAVDATPTPDPRAGVRDWKAEQNECRKVFVALGCRVYWLSQARRTGQTPGLGDLWVFAPRLTRAWWWETKHGAGKLSPAQEEFRQLCEQTGTLYGCGSRADAEAFAIAVGLAYRGADGSLEPTR